MFHRGFSAVLVVLIVAALGVSAYFAYPHFISATMQTKLYTSSNYSVAYPASYTVTEDSKFAFNNVYFDSPKLKGVHSIGITERKNDSNQEALDAMNVDTRNVPDHTWLDITLGGEPAKESVPNVKEINGRPATVRNIVMVHGNYSYQIFTTSPEERDLLVKTFKFRSSSQ
jgi:hypothetical protein